MKPQGIVSLKNKQKYFKVSSVVIIVRTLKVFGQAVCFLNRCFTNNADSDMVAQSYL